MDMPAPVARVWLRKMVAILDRIGPEKISDEDREEIELALAAYEPDAMAVPVGVDDDMGGGVPAEKIPLALMQMSLARERLLKGGDEAQAEAIGRKMDELRERL